MRPTVPCLPLAAFAALAAPLAAQPAGAQDEWLLVSGYTSAQVHAFDFATGGALPALGAAPGAQSIRPGPDGLLYVCAEEADAVLRFDGQTGAPLGAFVSDDPLTPEDETGGLDAPTAAVFGPDGRLYVASFSLDAVLRYDGATGAYVDDFIPAGTGAINGPDAGMDFGPDGDLFIPSFQNDRILRYDGKTGAPKGAFALPGALVLSRPRALRWRSDGLLYVTSWGNNRINRYALDGTFTGVFANVTRPTGIAFGADGNVYVCSDQNALIRRFDGATGAPLGTWVDASAAGVVGATWLELFPDRALHLGRPLPEEAGALNTFTLRNATPGAALLLAVGTLAASLPLPCPHGFLGMTDPLVFAVSADAQGEVVVSGFVDASAAGMSLRLQAYDPAGACLSNLVVATFD